MIATTETAATTPDPAVDAELARALQRLNESVATTAAVRAGIDLGVLAAIEHRTATAEEVAGWLGLSVRGTAQLLDTLDRLGLAVRVGRRFHAPAAREVTAAAGVPIWDGLPQAVRTGSGPHHADTADGAAAFYGDVVGHLGRIAAPVAPVVAAHLARDAVPGRVLEVGSGAAPWSRALARLHRQVSVTAVDLPPVLSVTRRFVRDDGLEEQYTYRAADVFAVDVEPRAYDLVLAPMVCHLFDEPANRLLLARLAASLVPGGRIAIIDILPGSTPDLARQVGLYALGLMVRTDTGGVHSEQDYRNWLTHAGLPTVARFDVPSTFVSVVTGSE